jgi:hypothetical protein
MLMRKVKVSFEKIGGRYRARAATSPQVQNRMVEILRMCAFNISNHSTAKFQIVKSQPQRYLLKRLTTRLRIPFHVSGSVYEKLEIASKTDLQLRNKASDKGESILSLIDQRMM